MKQTPAAENESPGAGRRPGPLVWRAGFLGCLAVLELPFVAFLYNPTAISAAPAWREAHMVMREAVPFTLFFLAALALLFTPQRLEAWREWAASAGTHSWRLPLIVNLALITGLAAATLVFNRYDGDANGPPWGLFALWSAAAVAAYGALALAAAPLSFWRGFLDRERARLALAGFAAMMIEAAAVLSRQSWSLLSDATFHFSAAILRLYESDVATVPESRVIGVSGFKVNIASACSGYEGIGLVVTFLMIYFWVFRRSLKFPNVFLVLPIGVAAIWVLNCVRIAMLVSLGAHVSPEIAITGFHSQAGWMMFLVVTIAIMAATHRLSFFHRLDGREEASVSPAVKLAAALLAPFLAMTAATILGSAFSAEGHYWVYGMRVAALLLALFAFWRVYKAMDWRVGVEPVLWGVVVGALWIATDPGLKEESALGLWLAGLPPAALVLWLAMRLLGTVLLVPLAEELAFRGYVHRKLIAEKFETVAENAFAWKAFLISSGLFALLHERWLAGAFAGAVFAVAMYRSGKLAGAVAAHMAANAVIAAWAIVFKQWTLL
ncbi:exosortase E/protease, VPEID-CTERM system [Hyphococcus luteus]|nr:exosortase E/protease, VPEID-CTERM system [Marinicaulis flavus]